MIRRETTTRQARMTAAVHAGKECAGPSGPSWRAVLRVAGAGLLTASGAIHLDLYLTGYRTIPVIGWLFLLQVIAAFGLGLAVLATGRLVIASRLAAAAGALFALATLGGYLLSVWTGLFGFTEVRTTAGIIAGVIDVAAFAVLAALALAPVQADGAAATPAGFPARIFPAITRTASTTAAALAVAALALLGVAVAGAGSPAPAATGTGLKSATIGGAMVLTNARGFTLYFFAPGYPGHIEMLRQLRRVLAPGDRRRRSRPGPAGPGRRDHPDRRLPSAHLQRASVVHLHRRQRSRPGPGQQPQPQRRPVARGARLPVRRIWPQAGTRPDVHGNDYAEPTRHR